MRVVHLNVSPGWRGGERQTLLLMRGLRALGVESVLMGREDEPMVQHSGAEGFEVVPMRKPFIVRARAMPKCDVVHAHESSGLRIAGVWKVFNGLPLIATRRVMSVPGRDPITRFKYRQADRLAAISNPVLRVMADWGYPSERMRVIPSAVLLEDQSVPERIVELKGRFAGKRVVGCVAALSPEKDHAVLLNAAKRIQDTRSDIVVLLVGDGKLRHELEACVRALGLTNVIFEGFQEDPYSYYKVFDVFVLCSRKEGLGSAILDAFNYGVPVVATSAGGIPDLLKDGHTGLLCPVGDDGQLAEKILKAIDDPSMSARLAHGARRHLEENFTVEKMASRYVDLYRELI